MRKFLGVVAMAACLSLVGPEEAKALIVYHVFFADYCDCITLQKSNLGGHQWFVGTWDWECTGGASSTLIHGILENGEANLGTQPIDSAGNPAGFSVTIHLASGFIGSDHADVTATFDGTTNVLIAEDTDYFLKKMPCPASTKPRMFP